MRSCERMCERMSSTVRAVRLPGAFVGWLEGTHAWQLPDDPMNDPAVVRMVNAVKVGKVQEHGNRMGAYGERVAYSVLVDADDECVDVLREYAEYLIDICQNGDDDPIARAELAAARKVWERVS